MFFRGKFHSRACVAWMNEERIIELEIKLAYQEDLLQDLNTVMGQQQEQILQLQEMCKLLNEKIASLSQAVPSAGGGSAHEIPPHY